MAGLPARPIADLVPGFIERASPDPGLGEPGRSAGIVGRVDPGRPHRRDAAGFEAPSGFAIVAYLHAESPWSSG